MSDTGSITSIRSTGESVSESFWTPTKVKVGIGIGIGIVVVVVVVILLVFFTTKSDPDPDPVVPADKKSDPVVPVVPVDPADKKSDAEQSDESDDKSDTDPCKPANLLTVQSTRWEFKGEYKEKTEKQKNNKTPPTNWAWGKYKDVKWEHTTLPQLCIYDHIVHMNDGDHCWTVGLWTKDGGQPYVNRLAQIVVKLADVPEDFEACAGGHVLAQGTLYTRDNESIGTIAIGEDSGSPSDELETGDHRTLYYKGDDTRLSGTYQYIGHKQRIELEESWTGDVYYNEQKSVYIYGHKEDTWSLGSLFATGNDRIAQVQSKSAGAYATSPKALEEAAVRCPFLTSSESYKKLEETERGLLALAYSSNPLPLINQEGASGIVTQHATAKWFTKLPGGTAVEINLYTKQGFIGWDKRGTSDIGHYKATHAAKSNWSVTYVTGGIWVNLQAGPMGDYLSADDDGDMTLESTPSTDEMFRLEGSTLGFRVKSIHGAYILGATILGGTDADVHADGSSSEDETIFRDKTTPETYVHMRIPDQRRAKRPRELICFVATD